MPKSTNNNPYNGYAREWRYNVNGTYQGKTPLCFWGGKNPTKQILIDSP